MFILEPRCAQIVPPSGGKRDTTPPRTVKYIPDSAAIHFKARQIAITFDEFVQINDLQKQLVISPPMNIPPEVRVKGKTVFIQLKDSLRKNTTYTFNFGNSIRDFTEGNIKENFQYVFSTGNYIDSIVLRGTVKNALDMKAEKDILVMLYDMYDDSVPYKKLPLFFAKTNADGSYKINHIRPGKYKAFALKDANSNYLYDLPSESIAFSDTLINISKNTKLDFFLFTEKPEKQKLKKAYVAGYGHLVFVFAKPTELVKLEFMSPEPKQNTTYEYSQERDTLHYWFVDDLKDSLKIKVIDANIILDTVKLKPVALEATKKSARGEKQKLKANTNIVVNKSFDLNKYLRIHFNHPIIVNKQSDFSGILIKENALPCDSCSAYFTVFNQRDNTSFSKEIYIHRAGKKSQTIHAETTEKSIATAQLYFNWKENSVYQVLIPPKTITDIFGLTNDTIMLEFKTHEEKYYGTFKLNLKMKHKIPYILQLINEKGELFYPISSERGIFTYNYLPPGGYKLRIIYDTNQDGKWTTGNYLQKRKPETVIYYPSSITIRSNWDMELDWKIE